MTRAVLIPLTDAQRAQIAANIRRAWEVHFAKYRRPVKAAQPATPESPNGKDLVK